MKEGSELIYPDLSYKVIGCLFEVANNLGYGHKEKFYPKALAVSLKERHLSFEEQKLAKVFYKQEILGDYFLDFLVENKVVIEIKQGNYFPKRDIEQLYSYLKALHMKLGIIVHFTKSGVKFKRVVNLN